MLGFARRLRPMISSSSLRRNTDFINVAGIESPGLVSSPAIGEYVADKLVGAVLPLKAKKNLSEKVKPYVNPLLMPLEERNDLIKKIRNMARWFANARKSRSVRSKMSYPGAFLA
jgi:L-2-hydroxyglutarate oxidase LhgO